MNKRQQKELVRTGKPITKLHVLGAAGGVTGSLMLVEFFLRDKVTRFLLDTGLHVDKQHADFQNRLPKGLTAKDIDFVIISHAHLDHSGYLPKLVKDGFTGAVYCTPATADLMDILLADSGYLQEEECKRALKRAQKRATKAAGQGTAGSAASASAVLTGGAPEGFTIKKPLYTEEEARKAMKFVRPIDYHKKTKLVDEVVVTFTDAGHILGSAVVMVDIGSGAHKRSLCFSGNIGRYGMPILRELEPVKGADVLVIESTYGNRRHVQRNRHAHLAKVINQAYERAKVGDKGQGCGVILIPAFAVGRAQVVMDDLRQLMNAGSIPKMPVYLDGRMSIKATELHLKHSALLNKPTREFIEGDHNPFSTLRFSLCREWQDSARLQEPQSEPIIIVGSSGMANGGRIVAHLQKRLSHPSNTVVFVGYQGTGTLGHALVRFAEGAPNAPAVRDASTASAKTARVKDEAPKTVNVAGKATRVRATIEFMADYSAHADYVDMLRWLGKMTQKPKLTLCVHGDPEALSALQGHIKSKLGWNVEIPKPREVYDIS